MANSIPGSGLSHGHQPPRMGSMIRPRLLWSHTLFKGMTDLGLNLALERGRRLAPGGGGLGTRRAALPPFVRSPRREQQNTGLVASDIPRRARVCPASRCRAEGLHVPHLVSPWGRACEPTAPPGHRRGLRRAVVHDARRGGEGLDRARGRHRGADRPHARRGCRPRAMGPVRGARGAAGSGGRRGPPGGAAVRRDSRVVAVGAGPLRGGGRMTAPLPRRVLRGAWRGARGGRGGAGRARARGPLEVEGQEGHRDPVGVLGRGAVGVPEDPGRQGVGVTDRSVSVPRLAAK